MGKPLNLLFTSVGRRVALLRAFRAAYEQLGIDGQIVAIDHDLQAPALKEADVRQLVPAVDHPQYVDVLLEIIRREKISVVFPLIDLDVPVLADLRERIEQLGADVATVDRAAAPKTADKWQTAQLLRELGIDTPSSWLPEEMDAVAADYPLFLKPRFGSASGGCFKLTSDRELEFFAGYVPEPIVQEFLPGPEITSDVICDTDGDVLFVVSRERILVRGGEVAIGKTVYDQEIADACVRIAEALRATGPITVQCLFKDGRPKFTEINARLGGGAPCGLLAGADWVKWLLARLAGLAVEIPPLGSYRTGVFFSRYDDAVVTTPIEPDVGVRSENDRVLGSLNSGDPRSDFERRLKAPPPPNIKGPSMTTHKRVHVIGSGGHAKVVLSMLQGMGCEIAVLLDDDPSKWKQPLIGVSIIGPIERIGQLPRLPTVVAVGDNAIRRSIAEQLQLEWLSVVHPNAVVDPSAQLGEGCVVMAGAVVQAGARLGNHVIINTGATVDHDCLVGNYAHVAPGATLAGNVTVGDGVLFGTGATSIPGVRIGAWTTVGAGAAVVRDLCPNTVAVGVPARCIRAEAKAGDSANAHS